jgi:DNA-binding LytR/AlgR family response regulator
MSTLHRAPTALIAEDEPLLAAALARDLAAAWPELRIAATVGDGLSAVKQALLLQPDVLFFDVRMPGLDGLDAAADIADQWPAGQPLPALVFVTAYDEYAIQAFERAAVDYLLKPLQTARLEQCLQRIKPIVQAFNAQAAINNVASMQPALLSMAHDQSALDQLRALLVPAATHPAPLLQRLQVSMGSTITLVPINDVLYFEAADKYVRVITADKEHLIRTPIKDLLPQLDAQLFWQIHRSTIVRASAVQSVRRDDAGRQRLQLAGRPELLAVSRLFAHQFKPM